MKYCSIVLLISFSINCFSQEVWTLDRCTEFALKNNLDLQNSKLDIKLTEGTINQIKFNSIPTINGGATQVYTTGRQTDLITNQISTELIRSNNFGLSSTVTLFSGLQNVYLKKQAISDLKIQEYNVEIIKRQLKADIAAAYLQILLNKEILLTYEEQLSLSKQQLERTKILITAGRGIKSEQIELEARIALDEFNVTKAKNDVKLSISTLKQLINLPVELDIEIDNSINDLIDNQGREFILENLPEIKQADEMINKNNTNLKYTKASSFPNLSINTSIGSGYSDNRKELDLNSGELITKKFNTQLNENFNQSATLSLSIPILNNYKTSSAIQASKIQIEKAKLEKLKREQKFSNEIQQLEIETSNSILEFSSSEEALKTSKVLFKNAKLKYEQGVIDYNDFNEIRINLFNAQSNFLQAKYKYYFKSYLLKIYSS